jgi:hypothetical protein
MRHLKECNMIDPTQSIVSAQPEPMGDCMTGTLKAQFANLPATTSAQDTEYLEAWLPAGDVTKLRAWIAQTTSYIDAAGAAGRKPDHDDWKQELESHEKELRELLAERKLSGLPDVPELDAASPEPKPEAATDSANATSDSAADTPEKQSASPAKPNSAMRRTPEFLSQVEAYRGSHTGPQTNPPNLSQQEARAVDLLGDRLDVGTHAVPKS